MKEYSREGRGEQVSVDEIEITEDVLTGRGGLAVFEKVQLR